METNHSNEIKDKIIDRLEDLLSHLELEVLKDDKMFTGICPIHEGDNQFALNLYHEGAKVPGYWVCNTHQCHKKYNRTIFGFLLAILSKRKGREVNFFEMITWVKDFLNKEPSVIKEKKIVKRVYTEKCIPQEALYKRLQIPSDYFSKRGFSKEILKKYEIGDCWNKATPMYLRAVVPIYDIYGKNIIGVTGRSFFNKCKTCKLHHAGSNCPDSKFSRFFSKWRNNGFLKSSSLYNFWFALPFIQKCSVIGLVEGPGDIFKIEEAGVNNCVGLYGVALSDEQKILIEASGAYRVVILLDPDKAGQEAIPKIVDQLPKNKILIPKITKDIKKMSKEEIRGLING